MAKLNKKELAARLLSEMNTIKNVETATGKVSFRGGFGFQSAESLLDDLLVLNPAVPDTESPTITWQALVGAAREGDITTKSFLKQAGRLESEYLSRVPKRYVLITEVSLNSSDSVPGASFDGLRITFPQRIPGTFAKARSAILREAGHSLHAQPPNNYRWVRVGVSEKSDAAAADLALKGLHLLVGLWNLWLNMGTGIRQTFKGPRKPVNVIALGPVHTVHRPSGALERQVWWYEPNYLAALPVKSLGANADRLTRFAGTTRQRLQRLPYRRKVEDYIRFYGRALDERDWSTSFIRLWQALEAATNTVNETYKVTVRRAAFIYRDHSYHTEVLDHLREYRNRLVHADGESKTIESKLYLLKMYVEDIIMFHVENGRGFSSLAEVSEFLDLPASSSEVTRRLRLLETARRLRSRTEKAEATATADS